MKQLLSALRFDLKFQFRHGFYYVYLVLSIIYILFLSMIPGDYKEIVSVFIIFSDPVMVGFFFIGAIVLLEKEQQVFSGLFVTPYRIYQYFVSKVFSLTILAVLSSLIIYLSTIPVNRNFFILMLGVFLSAIFFTLLGLFLAVKVKSLNEYILVMPIYMILLFLPAVELLGLYRSPLFYLFPSKPVLLLIASVFTDISTIELIYSLIFLLIWIVIFYQLALRRFNKYILRKV